MSAGTAAAGSPRDGWLAVVTGASRGLGAVVSSFLAAEGYDLILTARERAALESHAATLRNGRGQVDVIAGAVEDPSHRAEIRRAVEHRGPLQVLVNNASELGPSPLRPLIGLSLETFRHVLEVNLVAPLGLVQELRAPLQAAGGLVVNISSDAAVGAYPGWGPYGASKAALDLVSRTLAAELSSSGITIVSVDPGDMRTAMHQAAFLGEDISDRPLPDVTLPFWAWLLNQEPGPLSGRRFQAQGERWEVPA